MSKPAAAIAARLALGWVRLYTRGLPTDVGDDRRSEIESDLWEHEHDVLVAGGQEGAFALAALGRLALGIPADLLWRMQRRRAPAWQPSPAGLLRARRMRIACALVSAVAAAASVVTAAGLLLAGFRITVGANAPVAEQGPVEATNSPTVAVNPADPRNLVIVRRQDRPGFGALLDWSLDGGRSWGSTPLPLPAGAGACAAPAAGARCPYAPDAAFAPNGSLYVTYVALAGPGNRPEALWLARSSDGGRTLGRPVKVAEGLVLHARLAVDGSGAVHVTWARPEDVALLRIVGSTTVMYARSPDGGAAFSLPAPVSDPWRTRVGAATPVVDRAGNVLVLYQDFRNDVRDFGNEEGPVWPDPFALVVTRSADGGRTFSEGLELERGVAPARRFLVFLPEFPSIAAATDGGLYVAWSDARNGDEDVFLRRSTDGGRTWAPPARVNDNGMGDGTSQYLPRLSVAPIGRIDVLFLDRRRDPSNVMTDAFLGVSYDGARSFVNQRVSSSSFSSRVGPAAGPEHLAPDFGSRIGLASSDGGAVAVWADTRRGSEATGRQEVMAARVEVPDPRGAARRGAAAAGLLLLAGIAFAGTRMIPFRPRPARRGRERTEAALRAVTAAAGAG